MFASIQFRYYAPVATTAKLVLFLAIAATLLSPSAIAQDFVGSEASQTSTPVMLFDGTSTIGWGKANGDAHPGWVIEDGALHRKAGGGDLYHESTFRDFVLHFEWKISEGGNSGLKYRVRKFGNRRLGCEYQVLDDENNKREKNKTAGLYDVYSPNSNKPIVQPSVWQYSKIVVCGNRIEHWLNGVMVVQANVGSEDWKQHVADSKFRNNEGFGENREGRIFLQDHGKPVWYRNIVLVPLNCDSATVVIASHPSSTSLTEYYPVETTETFRTVENAIIGRSVIECPNQAIFQSSAIHTRPIRFRGVFQQCVPVQNCPPRRVLLFRRR